VRFSDYNKILHTRIPIPQTLTTAGEGIRGSVAYAGRAEGRVRIISPETIATAEFFEGDILVTDNTDIRFVPLMQKAGAIVTDRGGMLSHASIVARELKKPCIVGTGNATTLLKDGDMVAVDAGTGAVRILEKVGV
jgi:pyruvate,water dikinase